MNREKEWLSALKPVVNGPLQWKAFCDMVDYHIDLHTKTLEQSSDHVDIYRAQGAITSLKKFKNLRDEINAAK
jgi:hypothetical protein